MWRGSNSPDHEKEGARTASFDEHAKMQMTRGNKVILGCRERLFAIDTSYVASVTEVERVFFLPGSRRPVKGVIALRGEPVTVVDLGEAFGLDTYGKGGPHRIVVVQDSSRILGLDIGPGELSFLWDEDIDDLKISPGSGRFISATIECRGKSFHMLNWVELYDEAARILSVESQGR